MAYFGADGPVRPVDATPPAACWVPPSVADTGVLPLLHLPPGGTKGRQKKVLAVEPGPPPLARPRGRSARCGFSSTRPGSLACAAPIASSSSASCSRRPTKPSVVT